ncbi:redoxin domain-containing protein [Paenibacillus sp. LMG 31456]|uniref:thioredoxin-dependent peroxiredoxin n=1 Tax=Paenibacillus foliorum TaxID=2654974 RepID=A0A972K3L7_9BACL|nr:redoxin domain-containing protein [Paenibacillus foliorum]NOU97956.1 redoxin domain-containing protein [Paenibacillus foliorum]
MLSIGQKAPSFEADSTQGSIKLQQYLGKQPIVLIFYPKDGTPICTKQLCAARDSASQYAEFNALVLGINPATLEEHRQFSQKFQYDFPLLSDSHERIRQLYDVGKIILLGQQRCVIVIGVNGTVIYAKKGNRPTSEILNALRLDR